MFTGLIESVGHVQEISEKQGFKVLSIRVPANNPNYATSLGESIAVNGCCLTVTSFDSLSMSFDVSYESLAKTNLGDLKVGSPVNLERALALGTRLGGHMVSGHIDGTGTLDKIVKQDGGWDVYVLIPRDLAKYVIPKGSITLDGTSLTVNDVQDQDTHSRIRLTLIPATVSLTTFSQLPEGWKINIEVDLVGKYIERMMAHRL